MGDILLSSVEVLVACFKDSVFLLPSYALEKVGEAFSDALRWLYFAYVKFFLLKSGKKTVCFNFLHLYGRKMQHMCSQCKLQ